MHFSKNKTPPYFRAGSSILLMSLMLVGCGLLESKKADYKSVQRAKPLDIPPELSAPAKDDRYTVSEASNKGTTFSNYNAERFASKKVAPDSDANALATSFQTDKLRIQRSGNQRWLVVAGAPNALWSSIRKFVEARGLVVKIESAELGFIETEWAEKAVYIPQEGVRGQLAKALGTLYSSSERDKYRIRLEPGLEPGTTDVFISHRGVEEVYINEGREHTRWQPRANDPELEMELLGRLIQFLGADASSAGAIMAASAPGERARLVESAGSIILDLDERYDRAWRRVGLALDRNGFTVEDRDRAKGVYFVRYADPLLDKSIREESWLDWLAFWRDESTIVETPETRFRIAVIGVAEDLSRVEVQDKNGAALSSPVARKILGIVSNDLK